MSSSPNYFAGDISAIAGGFASYELAKQDPKAYVEVQRINLYIALAVIGFFVLVVVLALVFGVRNKQKHGPHGQIVMYTPETRT